MGIEKWSKKWMDEHKEASMQEFAVALSKRIMTTSISMLIIQAVAFIGILAVVALIQH